MNHRKICCMSSRAEFYTEHSIHSTVCNICKWICWEKKYLQKIEFIRNNVFFCTPAIKVQHIILIKAYLFSRISKEHFFSVHFYHLIYFLCLWLQWKYYLFAYYTLWSALLILDSVLLLCMGGVFSFTSSPSSAADSIPRACPCSWTRPYAVQKRSGNSNHLSIYLCDMFYILWISSLIKHLLQAHWKKYFFK